MSPAPKANTDAQEGARAYASYLLDQAVQLSEQSEQLSEKRAENRSALRGVVGSGLLDADEISLANEIYPPRPRANPEDRIARLESDLAKARERAEKQNTARPEQPAAA